MPHHAPLQSLREIVSGLSQRVAEAMDNKLYADAAQGLKQMDRLMCIDNIVVERLLTDSKRQVRAPSWLLSTLLVPNATSSSTAIAPPPPTLHQRGLLQSSIVTPTPTTTILRSTTASTDWSGRAPGTT